LVKRLLLYLTPNLTGSLISFLMLPLTTARLDAVDFGQVALYLSISSVISAIAAPGFSMFWASRFPVLKAEARRELVSSMMLLGSGFLFFGFGLLAVFWTFVSPRLNIYDQLSRTTLILIAIIATGNALWLQIQDILVLEGRSHSYAFILVASSVLGSGSTLIMLYMFSTGYVSLLVGAAVNSVVLSASGVFQIRSFLSLNFSKEVLRAGMRYCLFTLPANAFEQLGILIERNMLSLLLSVSSLGILVHSQSYRTILASAVKALARTIWPRSLEEAREPNSDFLCTRAAWTPIFVGLGVLSVLSTLVGKEGISIITHGKFENAACYVTAWFLYLVVQSTGKESVATIVSKGSLIRLNYLNLACSAIYIFSLYPAISIAGTPGVIAATIFQQLLYRLGLSLFFRDSSQTRSRLLPIKTGTVCLLCIAIQYVFWDNFKLRSLFAATLLILYSFAVMDDVRTCLKYFRGPVSDSTSLDESTRL
jgi:O-antigen/teichoic acid export membrane protein